MHLLLVGASHRTAPLELRERLDFCNRGLDSTLQALRGRGQASEAVVVSTCNRAELYVACREPTSAAADLLRFLGDFHRIPVDDVRPHVYSLLDDEAARHLFRVSAGLDSMVVGEPQILGQLKDAYAVASAAHSTGPLLNKLFHWAFGVGKRVRSETSLAEGAVSVSFAAVSLAKKIFGALPGRRVLVIGAGEMGRLTAVHLKAQGVAQIGIANRTRAHAVQLAAEIGGDVVDWQALEHALAESDIVIASTGSSQPVLSRAQIAAAIPARRAPLFLIDIAVPRDVDPSAADIEQVFLYNIDDLQAIVRDNLQKRGDEVGLAEGIVNEEVRKFAAWQRARDVVPTVVALRRHFDAVRTTELARLEHKLSSLPPEVRSRVDEVTRLLIEKLLLRPTEQLKRSSDPQQAAQFSDAVVRLFGLDIEEPSTADSDQTDPLIDDAAPAPLLRRQR